MNPQKTEFSFSASIERADNAPIVVSPYGFKEETIDGKLYLVAMTKEEYLEALAQDESIPAEYKPEMLSKIKNNLATCYMYTTMACATNDGCQWCHLGMVGTRYYCYCKNWPWEPQ